MTKRALVFAGRNGLDFIDLRMNVIRIPEVSLRISHAQSIFDSMDLPSISLMSIITADDEQFFRNIALKGLLAAVVQVGLYDRYLRTQPAPDYLVGCSNGDSAMLVAAGKISFEDMIKNSRAISTLRPAEQVQPLAVHPVPLLSGLSLTEYGAFEAKTNDQGARIYEPLKDTSMELKKIISTLHTDKGVTLFVNVGPASLLQTSDYRTVGTGDLEALDSIELDPMLTWFWRDLESYKTVTLQ